MGIDSLRKGLAEIMREAALTKQLNGGYRWWYFLDIVSSIIKYGARATDYTRFQFYKYKGRERNKFVTFYRHRKMMKLMDEIAGNGKYHLVDNKEDEYVAYRDFIHRDWGKVETSDPVKELSILFKTMTKS